MSDARERQSVSHRPCVCPLLSFVLLTLLGGCGTPHPAPADPAADATADSHAGSPPDGSERRSTSSAEGALCRCSPQPLANYFANADEVLMGRLLASEIREGDHLLRLELTEQPWRVSPDRTTPPMAGDTLLYLTSTSSAACGLEIRPGAHYLLFATAPAPPETLPRADSCDGSRVFQMEGEPPRGFLDIPGSAVVTRLDWLSGLDFLQEVARSYPDEANPTNESVVGLLELPRLTAGEEVTLFQERNAQGPVLAGIRTYGQLNALEVGYEVPAAVVLARLGGWHRLELTDGRKGWLAPADAGSWYPYSELPVGRLAYLTEAWSGHVWQEAGEGIPARSARKGSEPNEEIPVEVLRSMEVEGTIWFEVEILTNSPCFGDPPRTETTGWVPAYGTGGEPLVWYYSRGC